jgi:glycopeptide antibiotics resistance protein
MHTDRTMWYRWLVVGIIAGLISIIALGHNGHSTGVAIRLIPFEEYVGAITCLMQGCDGSRWWLLFVLIDGLGNLVIFMPLGIALDHALKENILSSRKRIAVITLIGALLSTSYELIQLFIPGRVTATDDVIINTTGTLLGALLALAFRALRDRKALNIH